MKSVSGSIGFPTKPLKPAASISFPWPMRIEAETAMIGRRASYSPGSERIARAAA